MASTFSAFYVAKSGIQAARANLQITGQNMTNVNTVGYTRQRVDTVAVGSNGNNMRYSSKTDLSIGGGVSCTGVSQIRDPYLDVRYRVEHAKTGETGTQLDTLNDLESVFDETTKDGIGTQFKDLITKLQSLAGNPTDSSLENIVKNSSLLLTKAINNTAQQLTAIRKQQTDSLENDAVAKTNNLLKNIASLNTQIKSADVSGTPALELKDQRNSMIDELSQYANIEITSKTVPVGGTKEVSELNISLVSGDKKFSLVSNGDYSQFGVVKDSKVTSGTPPVEVTAPVTLTLKTSSGGSDVFATGSTDALKNEDAASGAFGGYLTMLNDNGEYDSTTTTRGIGYYEKTLNKLASEFADMMNTANSTNTAADNKPLFASNDASTTTINATNISLSSAWNNATGSYLTVSKPDSTTGDSSSTPGENVLYMIKQFSTEKTYKTGTNDSTGSTLFTGSLNTFVSNISGTLALQVQDITRQDATYNSTLSDIDTQRASISSVDVNEEGINLIMYNQALTASSRFMTTMDEAMDTIINNTGRVGR